MMLQPEMLKPEVMIQPEEIFYVDRKARERNEKKKLNSQQRMYQQHAQDMNMFDGAIEKGKEILKKVHISGIAKQIRHKKIKSAAALFVACKMNNIKKDIKEIAFVTGTT